MGIVEVACFAAHAPSMGENNVERRLMQNCPSRTKPTKGSVVRHSKIGPPMTLWIIRDRRSRSRTSLNVRFAPQSGQTARGLAKSALCQQRTHALQHGSPYSIRLIGADDDEDWQNCHAERS